MAQFLAFPVEGVAVVTQVEEPEAGQLEMEKVGSFMLILLEYHKTLTVVGSAMAITLMVL